MIAPMPPPASPRPFTRRPRRSSMLSLRRPFSQRMGFSLGRADWLIFALGAPPRPRPPPPAPRRPPRRLDATKQHFVVCVMEKTTTFLAGRKGVWIIDCVHQAHVRAGQLCRAFKNSVIRRFAMQKKLIALALASAFAAPAFAATSNVDISGQLNLSVDYLDSDTVTNGGNVGISSNASNIIFKGSEDLGGGLNAIWQIQTYFSAGGTGNTDSSNGGAADGVGSGNTFVGLAGGFGKVILGKNESPGGRRGRGAGGGGGRGGGARDRTALG